MIQRKRKHYRIVKRVAKVPFDLCRPRDFELKFLGNSTFNDLPPDCLPYCTDFFSERLLFVVVDDVSKILKAPFVYQSAYERAEELLSIPAERMERFDAKSAFDPLLMFSVGRCGSTLLSALLNAANIASISEPDFLCQPAFISKNQLDHVGSDLIDAVIRTGVGWFEKRVGPAIGIKFRSQCNRAVALYQRALPRARYVFMFRDKRSWILSAHRTFGEQPTVLVRRLREGIIAFDQLVEMQCNPILVWYDDVQNRPCDVVMRLTGKTVGSDVRDAIDAVIKEDSQDGTVIAQEVVKRRQSDDSQILEQFQKLWQQAAPYALIEKHGLNRLL